jgi:hypothetical protein
MSELQLKDAGSEVLIIGANDQESFPMQGTFVQCLESDGELRMSMNNGSKMKFSAGLGRLTNDGVEFTSIQLFNDTDNEIIVEVGYGYGDIRDQRLQSTGNTPVINPSGQKLQVQDSSVYGRISSVLAYLNDGESLRSPLTSQGTNSSLKMDATSHAHTIFTPAENTAGALIRFLEVSNSSNSYGTTIFADTSAPVGFDDLTKDIVIASRYSAIAPIRLRDIFIPAGKGLYIFGEVGTYGYHSVTWDFV